MLLRVLRILRILRILRLLKGAKEIRDLIMTMVLSFPALINVGSVLALIVFMWATAIRTAPAVPQRRRAAALSCRCSPTV
jgi:hypothetical protein